MKSENHRAAPLRPGPVRPSSTRGSVGFFVLILLLTAGTTSMVVAVNSPHDHEFFTERYSVEAFRVYQDALKFVDDRRAIELFREESLPGAGLIPVSLRSKGLEREQVRRQSGYLSFGDSCPAGEHNEASDYHVGESDLHDDDSSTHDAESAMHCGASETHGADSTTHTEDSESHDGESETHTGATTTHSAASTTHSTTSVHHGSTSMTHNNLSVSHSGTSYTHTTLSGSHTAVSDNHFAGSDSHTATTTVHTAQSDGHHGLVSRILGLLDRHAQPEFAADGTVQSY